MHIIRIERNFGIVSRDFENYSHFWYFRVSTQIDIEVWRNCEIARCIAVSKVLGKHRNLPKFKNRKVVTTSRSEDYYFSILSLCTAHSYNFLHGILQSSTILEISKFTRTRIHNSNVAVFSTLISNMTFEILNSVLSLTEKLYSSLCWHRWSNAVSVTQCFQTSLQKEFITAWWIFHERFMYFQVQIRFQGWKYFLSRLFPFPQIFDS